jgi:hypothetical protein
LVGYRVQLGTIVDSLKMSATAEQWAWVRRVLNPPMMRPESAAGASPIEQWQAARRLVIGQIGVLMRAIEAEGDPNGGRAVILLRAVAANLTAVPDARGVAELARFITADDIVAAADAPNRFGIALGIRAQLEPALDALRNSARTV